MKILLCHNYYQQPGGEDRVFAAEGEVLAQHGHQVIRFTRHNNAISHMHPLTVAGRTIWNHSTYRALRAVIRRERPAVMHCTNTFPLISSAAYDAARAEGVAVVQSLHNYRLFCLNAQFLRHNRLCEDCVGKLVPWPGVRYACYRNSRSASLVVAMMLVLHRAVRTSLRKVHRYLAPSAFLRWKLCQCGLPAEQVATKPNFVHPDPGVGQGRGGFALFVGRLSPEKGVETLLNAWARLAGRLPLKIIGDGPLAAKVCAAANTIAGIDWLGNKPSREVLATVGEAVCLVMPSIWYETFGLTIIEAYARGTPVVASRLGAMAELVQDGRTGLLFEPGDPEDLVSKLKLLLADRPKLTHMRLAARKAYETKFTAETNYRLLMTNYLSAIKTQQRQ